MVLPDSTFVHPEEGEGFAFSSLNMLSNAHAAREVVYLVLVADGTYKLHDGRWPLLMVGTIHLHFSQGRYSHTFRPFAYMLASSESELAYRHLFKGLKAAYKKVYHQDLDPAFAVCDRAPAILNAFKAVFPTIEVLTCWPHVDRKVSDKCKVLLADKERAASIKDNVQLLHECTTYPQFLRAASLFTALLRQDGEEAFAAWLQAEYIEQPWGTWYLGASQTPGVQPNNNPLERFNRTIKSDGILGMRQRLEFLVREGFPNMLKVHAQLYRSQTITYTITIPTPVMVQTAAAHHLQSGQFFKKQYESGKVMFFFNTIDNCGKQVTAERVKVYQSVLKGQDTHRTLHTFMQSSQSLHAVTVPPKADTKGAVSCDCAQFLRIGMCSHIVATKDLLKEGLSVSRLTQPLHAPAKPGRKRAPAPALVRQEDADASMKRKKQLKAAARAAQPAALPAPKPRGRPPKTPAAAPHPPKRRGRPPKQASALAAGSDFQ